MAHYVLSTLAVFSAIPLCAQSPKVWSPPRTPDGHVDFQGIWNNSNLTPLERPADFGTKLILTEAEAAAFEKQRNDASNMERRDGGAVSVFADYLFRAVDVAQTAGAAVEAELGRRIARSEVDAVLTTEKIAIQDAVLAGAWKCLDDYRTGVRLSTVNIETVVAPPEAADAFRDVRPRRYRPHRRRGPELHQ
jgi:hypothetical protein